jgi:hypothetical protein
VGFGTTGGDAACGASAGIVTVKNVDGRKANGFEKEYCTEISDVARAVSGIDKIGLDDNISVVEEVMVGIDATVVSDEQDGTEGPKNVLPLKNTAS